MEWYNYNDDDIGLRIYQEKVEKEVPKDEVRQFNKDMPIEVPGFIMGNSFVEREALNKVGLFDESFNTWGGEDTDLAIRLWEKYPKGLRFAGKAIGDHYHKRKN